jgi:hypothetical protein
MSGTTWKTRSTATQPTPRLLPLQQPTINRAHVAAPAQGRATTWPRLAGPQLVGVVARPQTWRNTLYLALALPLGLAYTALLFGALALGGGLAMLILGVPLLLALLNSGLRLAAFERSLARRLLGVDLEPPAPAPSGCGTATQQFAARLHEPATWKTIGYLFVKLPLGLAATGALAALTAAVGGLLLAPALYSWTTFSMAGVWRVDSLPEALACMLLGVPALLLALRTLNALAAMSGAVARGLLSSTSGSAA